MTRKLLVKKFGGSSVATTESIMVIARHLIKEAQRYQLVVVVSAMGENTDERLDLIRQINPDATGREVDQLIHGGETDSAALMAIAINHLGGKAKSLTAHQMGLVADGDHQKGKIIAFKNTQRMHRLLAQGYILVCAGFQGVNHAGDIITLGRGGSDTTAVALAVALGSKICEFNKDVDGIFAVDPNLVTTAKRYVFLTYADLIAMTASGAEVVMTRAVELAQNRNILLRVVASPSKGGGTGAGTIIGAPSIDDAIEPFNDGYQAALVKKKVALITIGNIPNRPGWAKKILGKLQDIIIIDAIQDQSRRRANISILVAPSDCIKVFSRLKSIRKELHVHADENCAGLTLIHPAMTDGKGYIYRVATALTSKHINIDMLSTANNSIMVVIKSNALKEAALSIANEFGLCE